MPSFSDSSILYTLTVLPHLCAPLCQCSAPTPPSPPNLLSFFHTHRVSYTHPSALSAPPHVSSGFLCLLLPLSSLTPSGFLNGMLKVSIQGALNYFTLSRIILLTLFISRNLTVIHLPLSGSLNSLLSDLIAPTLDLAFSLLTPLTLAAASDSFSSDRVYLSLNFLPPFFLRLTPTLFM